MITHMCRMKKALIASTMVVSYLKGSAMIRLYFELAFLNTLYVSNSPNIRYGVTLA